MNNQGGNSGAAGHGGKGRAYTPEEKRFIDNIKLDVLSQCNKNFNINISIKELVELFAAECGYIPAEKINHANGEFAVGCLNNTHNLCNDGGTAVRCPICKSTDLNENGKCLNVYCSDECVHCHSKLSEDGICNNLTCPQKQLANVIINYDKILGYLKNIIPDVEVYLVLFNDVPSALFLDLKSAVQFRDHYLKEYSKLHLIWSKKGQVKNMKFADAIQRLVGVVK